jgi:HSP20 family protein
MILRAQNVTPYGMRLRSEVDCLFDDLFGSGSAALPFRALGLPVFPAVNVWEDGDAFMAEAELPGLELNEVEVCVVGDELTIKGERKNGCDDGASCHRRERSVGSFCRVLRIPVEVDADKVQATLKNGVLTITLPKVEAVKPRKITVEAG